MIPFVNSMADIVEMIVFISWRLTAVGKIDFYIQLVNIYI